MEILEEKIEGGEKAEKPNYLFSMAMPSKTAKRKMVRKREEVTFFVEITSLTELEPALDSDGKPIDNSYKHQTTVDLMLPYNSSTPFGSIRGNITVTAFSLEEHPNIAKLISEKLGSVLFEAGKRSTNGGAE